MAVDRDFELEMEAWTAMSEAEKRMCDLVRGVALGLVNEADALEVRTMRMDGMVVLKLWVADADRRFVIGRGGRTARAFRTIVEHASLRNGLRCTLDIMESAGTRHA